MVERVGLRKKGVAGAVVVVMVIGRGGGDMRSRGLGGLSAFWAERPVVERGGLRKKSVGKLAILL